MGGDGVGAIGWGVTGTGEALDAGFLTTWVREKQLKLTRSLVVIGGCSGVKGRLCVCVCVCVCSV